MLIKSDDQHHLWKVWDSIIYDLRKNHPIIVLESQDLEGYSYIASIPENIISSEKITLDNLFDYLDTTSWKFGYFSYDLKNQVEDLQSDNVDYMGLPEFWFMIPKLIIQWDHQNNTINVIKGELPNSVALENTIDITFSLSNLKSYTSKEEYTQNIKSIQQEIKEGEYYELNYSRLISADFKGDFLFLHKYLRKINPVPMASYIEDGEIAISCSSPEVFLIKKGNRLLSKPIKGTRARSENAQHDELLKDELLTSEKEKAENLMIVDLVRNDFSRIANVKSVEVTDLFSIHSFPTVHQMISTVECEIASTVNHKDIIKATFPMGSMTGAPKIAAMNAIEKYENYRRGLYSGAIGYINPEHDFQFNVVIRTAILKKDKLFYGTGGAITSDSIPEEEWDETITKMKHIQKLLTSNS